MLVVRWLVMPGLQEEVQRRTVVCREQVDKRSFVGHFTDWSKKEEKGRRKKVKNERKWKWTLMGF